MSYSYQQNSNDCNKSNELKIFTSPNSAATTSCNQMLNHFYPSPHSPPNEQDILLNTPMLQEQQQNHEDWLIQNQFNFCAYSNNNNNNSEASYSSGIRTPDLSLSDNSQLFGFTSFLNQAYFPTSTTNLPMQQQQTDQIQLIPSLSHQDHMMLLQKGYSENNHHNSNLLLTTQPQCKQQQQQQQQQQQNYEQTIFNMPINHDYNDSQVIIDSNVNENSILTRLSREQLIERVVQLEMERSNRSATTTNNDCRVFYEQTIIDTKKNPCHTHEIKIEQDQSSLYNQTENTEMYSCLWVKCSSQAPSLDKLMTHICENHIGSGKATYFCEWKDCARNKKPFMKRHKMHNHMRTHTGERPFVCTVIGCNKTFSRPDSLSTHIKTHSDIRPYLCSMPGCEKAYFHSRSLRKHIKSTHLKKSSTTATTSTTTTSVRRNNPSTTIVSQQQRRKLNNMMKSPVHLDSPHSLQLIPNTTFY